MLTLIFAMTLGTISCTPPDSASDEAELYAPGNDEEVKEKPGED